MARRKDRQPTGKRRTRTSATWVAVGVAVAFLVLLVIFIAQNDRKVPLHFLGASGNVTEAVALIAATLAGAILVLAIGTARIVQLRIGVRRQSRKADSSAASTQSET